MPTSTTQPTATVDPVGVGVTYVGNCGFLISVADKKVLVDALFAGSAGAYLLPNEVREPLLNAAPPFDGVDLILATHDHGDHFTAGMVRQHMLNNPETVFISTSQAAGQLTGFGERVIAVDPTEGSPVQVEANGIRVEAIYLSHGYPPDDPAETFNNAYVVTIGDLRFFHTGDINDLRDAGQYDLAGTGIDLAFISHSYMVSGTSRSTLEDVVGADYLFPMHFQYTQSAFTRDTIRANYPDAIVFSRGLETWYMPLQGN
jgi:L-ascorbate metabolism protein UlaG (beta-lactamase superfamily)